MMPTAWRLPALITLAGSKARSFSSRGKSLAASLALLLVVALVSPCDDLLETPLEHPAVSARTVVAIGRGLTCASVRYEPLHVPPEVCGAADAAVPKMKQVVGMVCQVAAVYYVLRLLRYRLALSWPLVGLGAADLFFRACRGCGAEFSAQRRRVRPPAGCFLHGQRGSRGGLLPAMAGRTSRLDGSAFACPRCPGICSVGATDTTEPT